MSFKESLLKYKKDNNITDTSGLSWFKKALEDIKNKQAIQKETEQTRLIYAEKKAQTPRDVYSGINTSVYPVTPVVQKPTFQEPIKLPPVTYPWIDAPARDYTRAKWVILPQDTWISAREKISYDINAPQLDLWRRPQISWSTPQQQEAPLPNPFEVWFWAIRATSQLASTPFAITFNELVPWKWNTTYKDIINKSLWEASKYLSVEQDSQEWMKQGAQIYLKSRWVGKYGWNKITTSDIIVLTSLWFSDLFWDPLLALSWMKWIRDFLNWRKMWQITREWGPAGWVFKKSTITEIPLADNLKISFNTEKWTNQVIIKWYIKRWTEFWEDMKNLRTIEWAVKAKTGQPIFAEIKWDDLILSKPTTPVIPPQITPWVIAQAIRPATLISGQPNDTTAWVPAPVAGQDVVWATRPVGQKETTVSPATNVISRPAVTEVGNIQEPQLSNTKKKEAEKYKSAEEFMKWQGTPVFHGTRNVFDKFDDTKLSSNTEWLNSKWGHFFTEDKSIAERFLNKDFKVINDTRTGRIIEANIDLKKPLDFTPKGLTTKKEQAQIIYEAMTGKKVSPDKALKFMKDAYDEASGLGGLNDFYDELYKNLKIKELAQKKGYDGLISHYGELNERDIKEYAVFSSDQIKIKSQPTDIRNEAHRNKTIKQIFQPAQEIRPAKVDAQKQQVAEVRRKTQDVLPRATWVVEEPVLTKEQGLSRIQELAARGKARSSRFKDKLAEVKKEKEISTPKWNPEKLAEKTSNKLLKEYNSIVSKEVEPTDEEMLRLDKISDKYKRLTWVSIEEKIQWEKILSLNSASKIREDLYEPKFTWEMWYRKWGEPAVIWPEKGMETAVDMARVERINLWKENFSIPEEMIKIVRGRGVSFSTRIPWTEWHSIRKTIGIDSILNPLLLAHELTHDILLGTKNIWDLLNDPAMYAEILKVYKKYYPWVPRKISNIQKSVAFFEWMSEFMWRALYDYKKTESEFPLLTKEILNNPWWKYYYPELVKLFKDLNNTIALYQKLNVENRVAAVSIIDLDWKKVPFKDTLLSKKWRAITYFQDHAYAYNVLDRSTTPTDIIYKFKNFNIDRLTWSTEMWARMRNVNMNIALNNTSAWSDWTYMINSKWELEKMLDFSVWQLISEIENNWDTKNYSSYALARSFKRDRIVLWNVKKKLSTLKQDLRDLEEQYVYNDGKPKYIKQKERLDYKIRQTERIIKDKEWLVKSNNKLIQESDQDKMVEKFWEKFQPYSDKADAVYDLWLRLQVMSWSLSEKRYKEFKEVPWYSPTQRRAFSDMKNFESWYEKTSMVPSEMKRKLGSTKPVISAMVVMQRMNALSIIRYNEQMFMNALYEKWVQMWLVHKLWKWTVAEPWFGIYAHKWQLTKFKITDPVLAKAVVATYWNRPSKHVIARLWRSSAGIFRAATTGLSPYFAFGKNLFLDLPTSTALSKTWYIPWVSHAGRLSKSVTSKTSRELASEYWSEYERAWWSTSSWTELSFNEENPMEIIRRVAWKESNIKKYSWNLWEAYKWLMSVSEKIARKEEFIRTREQWWSFIEAMQSANNISGSFWSFWIYMQSIIRYVPYINPPIQLVVQYWKELSNTRGAFKMALITTVVSALIVIDMYRKIERVNEEWIDSEERERRMNDIYKYLDKTSYEKWAYLPLGDDLTPGSNPYKISNSSFFWAPWNYISLLMLQRLVPEYKINNTEFLYNIYNGLTPNILTPSISDPDSFIKSIIWSIAWSNPVPKAMLALAGIKTYPWIWSIETENQLKNTNREDLFRADTNNLAIFLGQYLWWTWLTPLRIEEFIKALTSTMGGASTDLIGKFLLETQDTNPNIKEKSIKEILWTAPLRSALTQSTKDLTWETASKLYTFSRELDKQQTKMVGVLLKEEWVNEKSKLSFAAKNGLREIDNRVKEVNMVKDAVALIRKKESLWIYPPAKYVNALHRYILSLDSERYNKEIFAEDFRLIQELAKMQNE